MSACACARACACAYACAYVHVHVRARARVRVRVSMCMRVRVRCVLAGVRACVAQELKGLSRSMRGEGDSPLLRTFRALDG